MYDRFYKYFHIMHFKTLRLAVCVSKITRFAQRLSSGRDDSFRGVSHPDAVIVYCDQFMRTAVSTTNDVNLKMSRRKHFPG